ncbi:hypothetical protein [Bradyrhizobium hipponense]|uniref:hypothetical protein n=1 Tax=Bradyrhizobium hipponense TaxID=2605638 RepID=UPI001652C8E7|nr:hypothetical protein [Bradyrhizobium hipponense]
MAESKSAPGPAQALRLARVSRALDGQRACRAHSAEDRDLRLAPPRLIDAEDRQDVADNIMVEIKIIILVALMGALLFGMRISAKTTADS